MKKSAEVLLIVQIKKNHDISSNNKTRRTHTKLEGIEGMDLLILILKRPESNEKFLSLASATTPTFKKKVFPLMLPPPTLIFCYCV